MNTIDDPTAFLRSQLSGDNLRIKELEEKLKARYVRSERDEDIKNALDRLIGNACLRRDPTLPHSAENRVPGTGFAVIAPSGAGKSRTLDNAFRKHPAFPGYGKENSECGLLSVEAPSPCTMQRLAMEILRKLEYSTPRELRENQAWSRARDQLRLNKILVLHVGECQRVMHQAGDDEKQKIADTFVGLMESEAWPIQLILSGVTDLEDLFDVDQEGQLRRRLVYVQFKNVDHLEDGDMVEQVVREYAKTAGMEVVIDPESELIGRLCQAACHQFGLVMAITIEAIKSCARDLKNTLTIDDFANAYTIKTLQPVDQNPFRAVAWDTVDCSVLRKKLRKPTAATVDDKPKTKRRRRS